MKSSLNRKVWWAGLVTRFSMATSSSIRLTLVDRYIVFTAALLKTELEIQGAPDLVLGQPSTLGV